MSRKLWYKILGLLVGLFNVNLGGFRGRGGEGAHSTIVRQAFWRLTGALFKCHLCHCPPENAGRFEKAVSACKKVLQRAPTHTGAHLNLAVTYSMMGREREARAEAAEVLRINPKFSVDSHAMMLSFKDQSKNDRVVSALRKAGLK